MHGKQRACNSERSMRGSEMRADLKDGVRGSRSLQIQYSLRCITVFRTRIAGRLPCHDPHRDISIGTRRGKSRLEEKHWCSAKRENDQGSESRGWVSFPGQ